MGGQVSRPIKEPIGGTLVVNGLGIRFDVVSEYREPLLEIPWVDVDAWDAGGPLEAERGSSTGRIVVGALALGFAGALLGAATASRRYKTIIAVHSAGSELIFILRDDSPQSIIRSRVVITAPFVVGLLGWCGGRCGACSPPVRGVVSVLG